MAGDSIDAFLTFDVYPTPNTPDVPRIKGETKDSIEKGYSSIQIKSYSFDFAQDRNWNEEIKQNADGKLQQHDPQLQDVEIEKLVDTASPKLLEALCHGSRYQYAWIWQRRAGGQKDTSGSYFFKIELGDVTVTKLTWSASADDPLPREKINLHYNSLEVKYMKQKASGLIVEEDNKETTAFYERSRGSNESEEDGASLSNTDIDDIVKKVLDKIQPQLNKIKKTGT